MSETPGRLVFEYLRENGLQVFKPFDNLPVGRIVYASRGGQACVLYVFGTRVTVDGKGFDLFQPDSLPKIREYIWNQLS